ncbi:MAG: hypothetical protein GEV03_22615 [Streptosporangiales bacterium]|nr:hypothetical protein [Streptosporangiales bacterium]
MAVLPEGRQRRADPFLFRRLRVNRKPATFQGSMIEDGPAVAVDQGMQRHEPRVVPVERGSARHVSVSARMAAGHVRRRGPHPAIGGDQEEQGLRPNLVPRGDGEVGRVGPGVVHAHRRTFTCTDVASDPERTAGEQ